MRHAILIRRERDGEFPTGDDFKKAGFAVSTAIGLENRERSSRNEATKSITMPAKGEKSQQTVVTQRDG